jgi:hypothetical protein
MKGGSCRLRASRLGRSIRTGIGNQSILAQSKASSKQRTRSTTHVINQPTGTGIYFSADFDASQAVFNNAIKPHFEAIAAIAAAGNPYRIGVYSSGAVCQGLLDAGLVQLTWLSQSSGFRGTQKFRASRAWNILQALPVSGFCDFDDDVDPNTINDERGDFGGFLLKIAQPQVAALVRGPAIRTTVGANPVFRTSRPFAVHRCIEVSSALTKYRRFSAIE